MIRYIGKLVAGDLLNKTLVFLSLYLLVVVNDSSYIASYIVLAAVVSIICEPVSEYLIHVNLLDKNLFEISLFLLLLSALALIGSSYFFFLKDGVMLEVMILIFMYLYASILRAYFVINNNPSYVFLINGARAIPIFICAFLVYLGYVDSLSFFYKILLGLTLCWLLPAIYFSQFLNFNYSWKKITSQIILYLFLIGLLGSIDVLLLKYLASKSLLGEVGLIQRYASIPILVIVSANTAILPNLNTLNHNTTNPVVYLIAFLTVLSTIFFAILMSYISSEISIVTIISFCFVSFSNLFGVFNLYRINYLISSYMHKMLCLVLIIIICIKIIILYFFISMLDVNGVISFAISFVFGVAAFNAIIFFAYNEKNNSNRILSF